jgi:hypothetical protein
MDAGYSKEFKRIIEKIRMVPLLSFSPQDSAKPAYQTNQSTKTS